MQQIVVDNSQAKSQMKYFLNEKNNSENEFDFAIHHSKDGKLVYLTGDEIELLKKEKRPDVWNPNDYELAKEFPTVKPYLKQVIKKNNKVLSELFYLEKNINNILDKINLPYSKKEILKELVLDVYINIPRDKVTSENTRYRRLIWHIDMKDSYGSGKNKKMDIEKAKNVSITSLLKIDRSGFAKCVWHNEKTGSLKFYPKTNRVYCFGCQKSGDVIDVAMKMYDCNFLEAVKRLCN